MRKVFGLAALALAVAFSSCTKDDVLETGNGPDLNTALSFSFKAPQGNFVTRAIASNDEFNITKLDVYASVGGTVGALTGSQTAAAAGDDYWYTFDTSNNTYTITMTNDWIKDHLTQTVSFYFVGNDATSTEGTHTGLTATTETAFKKALTDALGTTSGQLNLIHQVNGVANAGKDLLFSAVIENIKVQGKVQKSSDLKRVESRFDVENEYYKDDAYKVTEIRVSNASRQGVIFPNAGIDFTDASIAGSRLSHVPIGGIAETAYDATTKLAESVFYLYPTEMNSVVGDGKTEITLMVSYDGAAAVPFRVDASAVNYEIEANKRYIIVLEPTEVVAKLKIADWDDAGDPLPAKPAGDDAMTLSAITGTAVGNLSGNIYTIGATGGLLEFTATTQYGTEFEVTDVLNNGSALGFTNASVVKTSVVTYGYTTVDTYKITVPTSSDANNYYFRLTISSPNGKASESIIFSKGTLTEQEIVDEILNGNDELLDAIKDAITAGGGSAGAITPEDLEKIETINVGGADGPSSLEGIENLPNLTEVRADDNANLTGSISLSGNPELTSVAFNNCKNVTQIDISNNPALEIAAFSGTGITSLDISNNPNLQQLGIAGCEIPVIDFKSESLTYIILGKSIVESNFEYTSVDFSGMPNLEMITIRGVNTERISSSASEYGLSHPKVKTLYVQGYSGSVLPLSNRALKTIDLSGLPALERVDITSFGKLEAVTGLNTLSNLIQFNCYATQNIDSAEYAHEERATMGSLNISGLQYLTHVRINYTNVKDVILSNLPVLYQIQAQFCNELEKLEFENTPLFGQINLNACPKIAYLNIRDLSTTLNYLNLTGTGNITVHTWYGFDTTTPRNSVPSFSPAVPGSNITFTGHNVE